MTTSDDSSFISGISNISRISKANSSTLYKFNSTCNISEWRSTCRDITKSSTTDSQKTDSRKLSETAKVNKALISCEESTCEYVKLKLMYECLEEIAIGKVTAIKVDTIKKLKEVITIHKIKKYLHLPNNLPEVKEELTLLGIIDLPKHEFTYQEQLEIKSCLEAKIREKIHNFVTMYQNLAGSTKDVLKSNESLLSSRFLQKSELEHIHWKDKIDEVCLEYKRDLEHCLTLFNQWEELKRKISQKNMQEAENLLLQAEIAAMKAKITKLSCTIHMYKETPVTIDAFKILKLCLDEKIASVNEEIVAKTDLKKAYDSLSNTEYDTILREYLELCYIIKKKRNLLDKL